MTTDYNGLCNAVASLLEQKACVLLAIDGGSCSGKTTMADMLQKKFGGQIIHMDDFYLRPDQRTAERYDEPGGNVDRERFLTEVITPLCAGKDFSYRPFDCKAMTLKSPVAVQAQGLIIIEGSYSLHPLLLKHYDLRVFLKIDKALQGARVNIREGSNARMFMLRWIPLEDRYHYVLNPEGRADLVIKV